LLSWDPPRSLLYGHRGLIVAIIELDERGQVRSVSLKQGTGDADIDGETRAALMKGKFCGAREGERGINTTFTVRFNITEPK
jgi:TonB family protein